jgi:hypothetical protein
MGTKIQRIIESKKFLNENLRKIAQNGLNVNIKTTISGKESTFSVKSVNFYRRGSKRNTYNT